VKLRLIDCLECPECHAELKLVDASGMSAHQIQERTGPSECRVCRSQESTPHKEAGVGLRTCAACYAVEIVDGRLDCERSHSFPVRNGFPVLLPGEKSTRDAASRTDSRSISASFSREWAHFEYDDKTWALDVQARTELLLKELDVHSSELQGKLLLDAGCGNGSLSRGINRFGCEVVAIDVSESVERAYRYFSSLGNDRTHFLRGDLMRHPFKAESFDFVFSSGVLHHNPDTRAAFESILRALKPGGKVYIWLYQPIPGWSHALKQRFRSTVAPLPDPLKHAIVAAWSIQSMARQYLRRLLGSGDPADQMRWRERMVLLLDHYTPRYRWEHTQDEVHGWYRDCGLQQIKTTEVREWGFGVVGTKPTAQSS